MTTMVEVAVASRCSVRISKNMNIPLPLHAEDEKSRAGSQFHRVAASLNACIHVWYDAVVLPLSLQHTRNPHTHTRLVPRHFWRSAHEFAVSSHLFPS